MRNFLNEKVASVKLPVNENGKLQQTQRNALTNEVIDKLCEMLQGQLNGDLVEVLRIKNGVGLRVDNDQVGYINFEIKISCKDIDFDLLEANESYQAEIIEKQNKAKEKAKAKAEKIKRDKEKRLKALQEKAEALKIE